MKKYIFSSAIGISVVALMIGLWSYSQAASEGTISICVGKNGLVYILGTGFRREDCRKNESLLTWNAQGVQGPKGDKGETGATGSQGEQGLQGEPGVQGVAGQDAMTLHLKDANGQDLGTLVSSSLLTEAGTNTDDRLYTTYLENGDVFLEFLLRTNRTVSLMGGRTFGGIYFRNLDCTNDAFLTTQPVPSTLYKAGTRYFKASEESLTLGSWPRATASNYLNGCQNSGDGYPLYILDEVSLPFSEPIAWPLRIVEE